MGGFFYHPLCCVVGVLRLPPGRSKSIPPSPLTTTEKGKGGGGANKKKTLNLSGVCYKHGRTLAIAAVSKLSSRKLLRSYYNAASIERSSSSVCVCVCVCLCLFLVLLQINTSPGSGWPTNVQTVGEGVCDFCAHFPFSRTTDKYFLCKHSRDRLVCGSAFLRYCLSIALDSGLDQL